MRNSKTFHLLPQYCSFENLFRDPVSSNIPTIPSVELIPVIIKEKNFVRGFEFSSEVRTKPNSYITRRTFFRRFQQYNFGKNKISFFPISNSNFFKNSKYKRKQNKISFLEPVYFKNHEKTESSRFTNSWYSGIYSSFEYERFKNRISFLIGTQVSIIFVPALSFSRYAFDLETKNSEKTFSDSSINSSRFLANTENELSGRFQYVATNIPDLVRLSFVCRHFKKPAPLSKVFALGLSSLPRNRKETQFLRFLIKLIKVFASQRTEILGVRIRFKGRVNRWRRTKYVSGDKGKLPLYTYSARIEIGESQAITRKGTLGIRIWIAYHPSFAHIFSRALLSFTHKQIK